MEVLEAMRTICPGRVRGLASTLEYQDLILFFSMHHEFPVLKEPRLSMSLLLVPWRCLLGTLRYESRVENTLFDPHLLPVNGKGRSCLMPFGGIICMRWI